MAAYTCRFCGYRIQKDNKPDKCNYCGKEGGMSEIESAEGLLDEL